MEIRRDSGILASYLISPSSKITNPEYFSQFKPVKDSDSNRVDDLINKTNSVTPHDILLTFLGKDKKFKLQGYLLEKITNKNCNVDLAN